jgi:hypothetical protein
MDKKQLASFVNQKKKGVYNLLIEAYAKCVVGFNVNTDGP